MKVCNCILVFIFLFSLTFISAEEFGYNYLEKGENLNPALNYSTLNVNNSIFLQGYTPTTLQSLFANNLNGTLNSIAWNCSGTSCYSSDLGRNYGVGDSTPSYKLEVDSGTTKIISKFKNTYGAMQYYCDSGGCIFSTPALDGWYTDIAGANEGGISYLLGGYGGIFSIESDKDISINNSDVFYDASTGLFNISKELYVGGNITAIGSTTSFGQVNKTKLYGNGNVRSGGFYDSGGYWGTTCYETELSGIGGTNSIWCIDNGGENLRFYDPTTDDVSMRANSSGWQIGDASHKKDLIVSNDIDMEGNFTGNQIYGEMYYDNHTGTSFSFAVQDTFYPVFYTDDGNVNGFSFVGGFNSSSNLTAQVAGLYKVDYRMTGTGENNHVYITTILVNGTDYGGKCHDHKKISAGGDQVPMGSTCFVRLNIGDTITSAVQDYGDTSTGDYYSGNINLVRVGN